MPTISKIQKRDASTGLPKGEEYGIVGTVEEFNYNDLTDLPKINGVPMTGNKTPEAYGLQEDMDETSALEIINLWNNTN